MAAFSRVCRAYMIYTDYVGAYRNLKAFGFPEIRCSFGRVYRGYIRIM